MALKIHKLIPNIKKCNWNRADVLLSEKMIFKIFQKKISVYPLDRLVGFLCGASMLCLCSTFQKIAIGAPLIAKGYLVPFLAGGTFGLIVFIWHDKLKKTHRELQKAHDILEIQIKKRTQKLHKTVMELEALFNNSQVGIMVLHGGRVCNRVNQRMADILGFTNASEMCGISMMDIHLNEKKFNDFGKNYYSALQKHEVLQIEYQLRHQNGNPVWCILSGKALDSKHPADLNKGVIWMVDDISERKQAEAEREKLVKKLQSALEEVNTLSGLLPICSHCKKIRDDKGYWTQIESYIHEHSGAEFSHSICQECAKKYYPDMDIYEE